MYLVVKKELKHPAYNLYSIQNLNIIGKIMNRINCLQDKTQTEVIVAVFRDEERETGMCYMNIQNEQRYNYSVFQEFSELIIFPKLFFFFKIYCLFFCIYTHAKLIKEKLQL